MYMMYKWISIFVIFSCAFLLSHCRPAKQASEAGTFGSASLKVQTNKFDY